MTGLRQMLRDYLSVRRALGYKLEREGSLLAGFVSFLERRKQKVITTKLALEWATQPVHASVGCHAQRLGVVRCFAKYVRANDHRTQIPAVDLLPFRKHRPTPYVYSATDIAALLRACERLGGVLKPHTFATLIGLLVVTGMRISEAINLDRLDINEREQLITVRNSKFGKSRELPVHSTTIAALKAYATRRDHLFRCPKSPSFFLSQRGTRLTHFIVWYYFDRHLRPSASLDSRGSSPPRIHDLRHTFAVRTLLKWYRDGSDVEPRLALLSTYMGHVNPSSTYWYLTGTPELMALAATRLENALETLSKRRTWIGSAT